ncbi:2OG-Fe(II) oxygenase [Hyphococcus flavus]|uniref:2OG-Fe(II) oxygenase n=1 Tax=Hyphococcus flavus TaxID=1866326 RepID=A0AAE9ZF68_9PROT|nr:2OG-Fe(II) oxygenase [Hyphococcus flavus]WDI32660.1 2OG-Fe(II) oxygenase [Hyphococcus flavus]
MVNGLEADIERLDAFAAQNRDAYDAGDPFPHIAIEDFVHPEVIEGVLKEVEAGDETGWSQMDDRFQKKHACNSTRAMGPKTRALIQFLNGQEVIMFLEKLTGIEGLVPDPFLAGGGLHQLRDGGFLGVHADFNFQKHMRLDRRINLLLYLNKGWEEDWGGNLELWDTDMKHCVKRYAPSFNRCVIFNTTDKSFHGNPQPVKTPDGRVRRSIAMYYYTNGRPDGEVSGAHMTLFQYRPGEGSAADRGKRLLKRFVPPIITDWLDDRRNR